MSDKELFLLGGAAALVIALIFLVLRIRFLRRAVTTQGTVTGHDESTDSEGGTSYHPIVNFQTADGRAIQFTHDIGGSRSGYPVGETVPVKYLADNPQKARIGTATSLWWFPASVGVAGVGLLVWGLFFAKQFEEPLETDAATNVPAVAEVPAGSRITIVDQANPKVTSAECVSIRDTQSGTIRDVELRLDGDQTLTFKVSPYSGPKAYSVPTNASVGGTIFEGRSPSGAVVFTGAGQNGVVNLSAAPKSVSGNWDCTKVELQRS